MTWTDHQIQTLKSLWGHGTSASAIAKALGGGLTRNAIIGKAHRLKLLVPFKKGTGRPQDAKAIKGEASGGKTVSQGGESRKKIFPALGGALKSHAFPASFSGKSGMAKRSSLRAVSGAEKEGPGDSSSASRGDRAALFLVSRPASGNGIPAAKLGERNCRWPIGDPLDPAFHFCGCSVHEGLPYCTEHARIAYQTASRRLRMGEIADSEEIDEVSLPSLETATPAVAGARGA